MGAEILRMGPCSEPGCPEVATGRGRCDECRRAADKQRGTSKERGYGAEHRRRRRQDVELVASGKARCWRCGEPILPDDPWDEGHDDFDRTVWRGPECRPCNRSVKSRSGIIF